MFLIVYLFYILYKIKLFFIFSRLNILSGQNLGLVNLRSDGASDAI